MEADWDVVVVGRSFAGLSAALTLGRVRRSVLVIGSGGPRNEAVLHTQGFLSRDGASPDDLVSAAEADLAGYPSVQLVDGHVSALEPDGDLFRVTFDGRTSSASNVILATGVNDDPVPIPGLAEHWGRGVFTCPFCDGFEHQDLPIAVVGDPLMAPHLAVLLTALSDRVTVHAEGLDPEVRASMDAAGVVVEARPVVRVVGDGTAVTGLELADGTLEPAGAVFAAGLPHPNNQLAVALGCKVDDAGFVAVNPMGRTDVDRVWAAGDLTTRFHQMSIAIAAGSVAGADVAKELILGGAGAH